MVICCDKNVLKFQQSMMNLFPSLGVCWILFDGTWHDECQWIDSDFWID